MTLRSAVLTAFCAFLFPLAASASGFLFGENGARALSLGGAFTAQADDLTAIQHNPSGLSQLEGFHFLLDIQGLNHEVGFQRRDVDPETGAFDDGYVVDRVQNQGGLFFLPFIGAGYGTTLAERRFHVAFGVYGPPSVGRYRFPEPNYARTESGGFEQSPIRTAPQRYGLIENDIIVLFPSLAASYEVHPKFAFGVSLQYVYSRFTFRQAVTSILEKPASQIREDPAWDSLVAVDLLGKPAVTGILGVRYQPTEWIQLGLSYRPPVPLTAEGTATVTLGEEASKFASITGDQASFGFTLPQELKLGVQVRPTAQLAVNADLVYQGWQSIGEFVLTPIDIQQSTLGGEPEALEPIDIPKKWHHAWSGRLGAQYRFGFGLTARAGVLYEQSAVPEEFLHIDFLHLDRAFFTGGLEYEAGPLDVILSGAWTPTQTKDITTSAVRQANTDPTIQGNVVGNGTYASGGWIASVGVRGRFGVGPKRSQ